MSRMLERADVGVALLVGKEVTLLARLVLIGPLEPTFLEGDLEKELCVEEESRDASFRFAAMDVRARGRTEMPVLELSSACP